MSELGPQPNKPHGRTWPDLVSSFPIWILAFSFLAYILIGIYAVYSEDRIEWGWLGQFGPVASEQAQERDPALSLPSQAVLAFYQESREARLCPEGWEFFEPAGGRFVLGAGPHDNAWLRQADASLIELQNYPSFVGETDEVGERVEEGETVGGEAEHVLTEPEMPSHSHASGEFRFLTRKGGSTAITFDEGASEINIVEGQEISSAGGGLPHNNLPPYIALIFCTQEDDVEVNQELPDANP